MPRWFPRKASDRYAAALEALDAAQGRRDAAERAVLDARNADRKPLAEARRGGPPYEAQEPAATAAAAEARGIYDEALVAALQAELDYADALLAARDGWVDELDRVRAAARATLDGALDVVERAL